jgi:hypothetical protein
LVLQTQRLSRAQPPSAPAAPPWPAPAPAPTHLPRSLARLRLRSPHTRLTQLGPTRRPLARQFPHPWRLSHLPPHPLHLSRSLSLALLSPAIYSASRRPQPQCILALTRPVPWPFFTLKVKPMAPKPLDRKSSLLTVTRRVSPTRSRSHPSTPGTSKYLH